MIPAAVAGLPLFDGPVTVRVEGHPHTLRPVFYQPPSVPVDTSEASSDAIRPYVATLRDKVYVAIREAGNRGATAEEICDALELAGNTVRPRLVELELAYRIEKSPEKRMTRSGRWARTYRVRKPA